MKKYRAVQNGIEKLPDIGPSAFALYVYLVEKSDKNGDSWPGYGAIKRDTGLSDHTVANSIKILVACKLVSIKKAFKAFTKFTIYAFSPEMQNTSLIKDDDVNCITGESAEMQEDDPPEPEEDGLGPWGALSQTFEQEAGINYHAPERWKEAIDEMLRAGVEPDDMKAGVEYVRSKKHLTLRGPWSVINAAIIELGKRKGKNGKEPEEFYDYATGTYQRVEQ
jgi:hypothetical protein